MPTPVLRRRHCFTAFQYNGTIRSHIRRKMHAAFDESDGNIPPLIMHEAGVEGWVYCHLRWGGCLRYTTWWSLSQCLLVFNEMTKWKRGRNRRTHIQDAGWQLSYIKLSKRVDLEAFALFTSHHLWRRDDWGYWLWILKNKTTTEYRYSNYCGNLEKEFFRKRDFSFSRGQPFSQRTLGTSPQEIFYAYAKTLD